MNIIKGLSLPQVVLHRTKWPQFMLVKLVRFKLFRISGDKFAFGKPTYEFPILLSRLFLDSDFRRVDGKSSKGMFFRLGIFSSNPLLRWRVVYLGSGQELETSVFVHEVSVAHMYVPLLGSIEDSITTFPPTRVLLRNRKMVIDMIPKFILTVEIEITIVNYATIIITPVLTLTHSILNPTLENFGFFADRLDREAGSRSSGDVLTLSVDS